MKIGELAHKTGIAASAIRFYEQSGLMPAPERGSNGYRRYPDSSVQRLRLIQIAQTLGFSLDTLRGIFTGDTGLSTEELLCRLDVRLEEIDSLMSTLRAQRQDLRRLRESLLAGSAAGECVDAEALAASMVTKPLPAKKSRRNAAG